MDSVFCVVRLWEKQNEVKRTLGRAIIKFKDIEYLIKRQMPDIKFEGWTEQGAVVNVNFVELNARKMDWKGKDITLYTFKNLKPSEKVDFAVRQQIIEGVRDLQLIIQ